MSSENPFSHFGTGIERSREAWRDNKGPEALGQMREAGFFRQFAMDDDYISQPIADYCAGIITREELDGVFLKNNDENLVGEVIGEGKDQFTITAVGPQAQMMIFEELHKRTGVKWW